MTVTSKVEGIRVHRVEGSEMRFVTLKVSQLAFEALGAGSEPRAEGRGEARMELAIRFYLHDKDQGRPEWLYPAFLRGSEVSEEVELRLGLDTDLWRVFENEATRQAVSVAQLAEHAAFYLAAELDAGRITQRILDDLESHEASN
jgi:hypothetical protein